ncbi:MAG: hypothetical protein NC238_03025 [Dehalobacter sp.]|nr:hypothetical protein [Dehalobacter sp.]
MTLEELKVLITGETSNLRKEIASLKKQLNSVDKEAKSATSGINAAFKSIKTGATVTAVIAALALIVKAFRATFNMIKGWLDTAGELQTSLLGLQSILEGQGRSVSGATKFIQSYIEDGLVPLTDAVTAYKNLAARGYTDDQIQEVLGRLKDAASFGRQSSYTLGEAVKSATEGLKNENSILVDNAGVTKNVAKMWEEYAQSIGKSTNDLTQQEKIQAEVAGIMEETKFQIGDAARYAATYNGQLSALSKTLKDIKVNLGQAFMPIAMTIIPLLQSLAKNIAAVTSNIAQFMQALFGSDSAQAQNAKSAAKASKAETSLAQSTKSAGTAAKKGLAAFDELNILQKKTTGGSDVGSSSSTTTESSQSDEGATENGIPQGILDFANKVRTDLAPVKAYLVEIGGYFQQFWGNIQPALKPIISFLKEMFIPIWATIKFVVVTAFEFIKDAIRGALTIIQGVIKVFGGIISGDWSMLWDGVKDIFKGSWDIIYGVMKVVAAFMQRIIKEIANAIKVTWGALWTDVKNSTSNTWNWLSTKASAIFNGIKNTVVTAFTSAKNVIATAFEGIKLTVKNAINWAITKVNYLITKINNMAIVEGVRELASKAGFTIPKIPTITPLAQGALAYGPTFAMVGDNVNAAHDPEVISPLSKLQDMLIQAINKTNQNNYSGPSEIVLKIGETEFGRVAIKSINNVQRQAGITLLQV